MRASEILQGLAELMAGIENGQPSAEPVAQITQVTTQSPVSKFDPQTQEPTSTQDAGVFVPPLQAKIELLKKAVEVDNVYDHGGPEEDLTGTGADNDDADLAHIRKMAGVHPVVQDMAGEDEPLDS